MATDKDPHSIVRPRGRIGDLIYKWYGDKCVVTKVPKFTKPASPEQSRWRRNVSKAFAYTQIVIQDPELLALYTRIGEKTKRNWTSAATRDCLTLPEVSCADLRAYHGAAGETIKVHFTHRHKMVTAHLKLRDARGTLLEEGDMVGDSWSAEYQAQQPHPGETEFQLEVTTRDLPGHVVNETFACQAGQRRLIPRKEKKPAKRTPA
jgi:hypothetical protein